VGLSHSPVITTDGLILCLDAANVRSYPGSGTIWYDLSTLQKNGTLINSPTFNNRYFTFDGVNERINGTPGLMNSELISISVWVKPQNSGNVLQGLVTNGYTGSPGRRDFNIDAGRWQWINGNYDYRLEIYDMVDYDKWQNVVATSETVGSDTVVKMYKNGIEIGTKQINGYISSGFYGSACRIGYLNSVRYFCGDMAFVSIYNKTLKIEEVQNNYLATKGRFGL